MLDDCSSLTAASISSSDMFSKSVPDSKADGKTASSFDGEVCCKTCARVYAFFFAAAISKLHTSSRSSIVAREVVKGDIPLPCDTLNTFLGISQNESNIDVSGSRLRK